MRYGPPTLLALQKRLSPEDNVELKKAGNEGPDKNLCTPPPPQLFGTQEEWLPKDVMQLKIELFLDPLRTVNPLHLHGAISIENAQCIFHKSIQIGVRQMFSKETQCPTTFLEMFGCIL